MTECKGTKPKLLDNSSSDSEDDFKINNSYATAYDKWRSGEELQKLKDKYGSDPETSSSSESEEEDPIIEKDFLKTLSFLKSKDPQIYDEKVQFFNNEDVPKNKCKEKKPKPLYPKDYERKMLLETNGKLSESDDDGETKMDKHQSFYDKEQEEIKKSFQIALQDSDADDDEELLQVRQKDQKTKAEEELDYIEWLKGEKDDIKSKEKSDLSFLRKYWNDPELDEDERFLKDYILNKKYIDEDCDSDDIPTYEEITGDVGTLSDDEKLLEKQEIFEHKYNFRFEEPDEEFIKKYPRTVEESLRKKGNKRKVNRKEYHERKKREKEQKKEEIRQLKALKRKEIEEKLDKLRETVGNEQLPFNDLDVEGDFDPDEHDKKMQKLFSDNFYDVEESLKPKFDFDEELDAENWDNWTGDNAAENDSQANGDYDAPHCEDPDFNMDADYDPKTAFQQQMIESSQKKNRRHRKKSKFAQIVEKSKPVFDSSSEKYEKYINEYYKLDCEDIIGDLPVRFKYHSVVPNDFGLSVEEIWASKDKELNQWCSMKKVCGYRRDEEEIYDVQAFSKKSQNVEKKRKILFNYFNQLEGNANSEDEIQNPSNDAPKKKKKRKKKNQTVSENSEGQDISFKYSAGNVDPSEIGVPLAKNDETEPSAINGDSKETLPEDKKEHKKKKRKRKLDAAEIISDQEESIFKDSSDKIIIVPQNDGEVVSESVKFEKKKKKRKKDLSETLIDDENRSASDTLRSYFVSVKHQPSTSSEGFIKNKDKSENWRSKKKRFNNEKDEYPINNNNSTFSSSKNMKLCEKLSVPDSRLKMYGINPKKFKNRLKYGKK